MKTYKIAARLKLLIVTPFLVRGGAERIVAYLLKYLNRNKFELNLCLFEYKLPKELPNDVLVSILNKKDRWNYLLLCIKLNRVIRRYKPDLIYSNWWYATSVATIAKLFYKKRLPLIAYEPHNHKQDILPEDPFRLVKRFLIDWSHRRADLVISVSKGAKQDIASSYKLESQKMKLIYHSVDLELVEKDKHEKVEYPWFKDNIPVIITVGQLILRKGLADLIKAFHLVCSQLPSRLVLIGEGRERPQLERLTTELNLSRKVQLLGYQENPFKFIARSAVFAFPSHREGFGNVIIEAMACGVPVISTDCPYGPDEIITDGVNGLMVPVGDIAAMGQAILKVLKNEHLRRRLAEEGRKRAEDFRVEKMVAEYEKVFEEVVEEK